MTQGLPQASVITFNSSTPFNDAKSWDTLVLNETLRWFGRFQFNGAERSYKWDIKDGIGLQGAIETYRGQTPQAFELVVWLWTDLHFQAWPVFANAFRYDGAVPGIGVNPVNIYHPSLSYVGIYQVICEGIGVPEPVDEDNHYRYCTVTVKLREYFPPLPINTTKTPDAPKETENIDPELAGLEKELGATLKLAEKTGVFE